MALFGGNQNSQRVGIVFSAPGYRDFTAQEGEIGSGIIGVLKDVGYGQYGVTIFGNNRHGVNPGFKERWSLMIQPTGGLVHFNTFTFFRKDTSTFGVFFYPDKDNKDPDSSRFDALINAAEEVMGAKGLGCSAQRIVEKADRTMLPFIDDYVNTRSAKKQR